MWLWPKFVSVLEPRLTTNAGLRISIFSNPSYSYMCNFVSGDKFQFALSHETKFHIQKCNTCRNIEIQSRQIKSRNGTVPAYQYNASQYYSCKLKYKSVIDLLVLALVLLVLNLVPVLLSWKKNKTWDIAASLARRDHRKSKFGLRHAIKLN